MRKNLLLKIYEIRPVLMRVIFMTKTPDSRRLVLIHIHLRLFILSFDYLFNTPFFNLYTLQFWLNYIVKISNCLFPFVNILKCISFNKKYNKKNVGSSLLNIHWEDCFVSAKKFGCSNKIFYLIFMQQNFLVARNTFFSQTVLNYPK